MRAEAVKAAESRGDRLVISDIPLLFEVGLEHAFDGVILVDSPEPLRLQRMVRDRGLSPADAQAMIDAQWPAERKRAGASWVIDNDDSLAELQGRVDALWEQLQALPPRGPLPQPAPKADTTTG